MGHMVFEWLILLKIWVQIHSIGALGCKHVLSHLIINLTYEYTVMFSLT